MYMYMHGFESKIQIGATVALNLGGICSMALDFAWLCDLFDTDAIIEGNIYTYVSKNGIGIKMSGRASLNLK